MVIDEKKALEIARHLIRYDRLVVDSMKSYKKKGAKTDVIIEEAAGDKT